MDFIGSLGGLLGLCMGFSFVTIAEILYYGADTIRAVLFSFKEKKSTVSRRENRKIEAARVVAFNNDDNY